MSFSVSCAAAGSSTRAAGRSRRPRNAASPRFLALLWEIGRWLRTRGAVARATPTTRAPRSRSTSTQHGYSQRFRAHFLVPLTSALWSTAPGRALEFPAAYAIRFFEQPRHARLRPLPLAHGHRRQPTLRRRDRARGSTCGCSSGAARARSAATRTASSSRPSDGETRRFDHVVVATHADQALALLEDPTRGRAARARRLRLHARTRRCCTPTRRSCRAARGPRLVELPPRRRRAADAHLLPQPAAAARGRRATTASR